MLIKYIIFAQYGFRSRLRCLASRESINVRRASSTRTDTAPVDPPTLPEIPEVDQPGIEWEVEPENIPDADAALGNIWTEVFRICPPVNVQGQPESSLDGTNDAGSFQSINDSEQTDDSDEDEDELNIAIDPAPGGISVESRLQEGFRVEVAKTGE